MQKWILSLIMVALLATPALAFKDVPPNHWAYDAINKAVEKGILQGYNNLFHGKKTLNRFQMAVVVARMLDRIGTGGGGVDKDALKQLEALVTEFADELALLNVKVGKLEETIAQGPKPVAAAAPVDTAAPGSVVIGDGALKMGGIFKNWYTIVDSDTPGAIEAETFALRNARLLFWHKFTDDISLFVQTDHAAGNGFNTNGDILDVKATIKMPNSENKFSFGRFLPKVTAYMHKNITQLDFINYPIAVGYLGNAPFGTLTAGNAAAFNGRGIWRQDGFTFEFGEDTTFMIGLFDGTRAWSGLANDDEDKALMLRIDFKGTEKLDGAIWLWQDENSAIAPAVGAEFDAMGLYFTYKHDSFDFMFEYMTMDWNLAGGTSEADSMMAQFIVPMTKDKTDFMLRIEQYDYDGGAAVAGDLGDHDRMTVGFRWKMHERAYWQLEYWADEFNGGNTGAVTGDEPSTIAMQLMMWF